VIYSLCFQNGLLVIELEFFHSHQTPAKNNPKGELLAVSSSVQEHKMPEILDRQALGMS
jgi:hypothetical protein